MIQPGIAGPDHFQIGSPDCPPNNLISHFDGATEAPWGYYRPQSADGPGPKGLPPRSWQQAAGPWSNFQPQQSAPAAQNRGLREDAPMFGGHFSPLGGAYQSPSGPFMSPGQMAIIHNQELENSPLEAGHFTLKEWLINPKTPKTFEEFRGKSDQYLNWSSRVKDHLMAGNLGWGRVLEICEKQKQPLTKRRLATIPGIDDAELDLVKVSQALWGFLGNHALHNSVYDRRVQLTGGER